MVAGSRCRRASHAARHCTHILVRPMLPECLTYMDRLHTRLESYTESAESWLFVKCRGYEEPDWRIAFDCSPEKVSDTAQRRGTSVRRVTRFGARQLTFKSCGFLMGDHQLALHVTTEDGGLLVAQAWSGFDVKELVDSRASRGASANCKRRSVAGPN